MVEVIVSEAVRVNDSVVGRTIYKNTANVGDYKLEIRYFSILKYGENNMCYI